MRCSIAIAKRILQQFSHDKRTLALLFVAPMVVLWLLTVLLGSGDYVPRLACVDLPEGYYQMLEKQGCTLQGVDAEHGEALLRANEVDAVLRMGEDQTLVIWAEGSDSTKTAACSRVAADAMGELADDATTRMKDDVDAKKAEVEKLKADAFKKQDDIKELIEGKKAELEDKKGEIASKKSEIERKKAQIERKVAKAKADQKKAVKKLKSKLKDLKDNTEKMSKTLKALVAQLPADKRKQYAPMLSALEKTDKIDIESLGIGTSGDSLNLDLDFDLDSAFDVDSVVNTDSLFDIDTDIEFPDMDDFSLEISDYLPVSSIDVTYLHGNDDWKMFDFYGPVFIGIFLFAFVFITSGMSLVNERSAGTMERFLATPVRPPQVLGGYLMGFGLLAAVQATVVLWFSLNVIGFPNEGSILLVVATVVLLALASVSLGLLVSGLATSAFQVIQLMLVFVVPQILLSGLFDLGSAPQWLQALSRCLPLTYGVDALRAVMLRGAGIGAIGFDLAVVGGFVALFFVLASLGFRKKHARRAGRLRESRAQRG